MEVVASNLLLHSLDKLVSLSKSRSHTCQARLTLAGFMSDDPVGGVYEVHWK